MLLPMRRHELWQCCSDSFLKRWPKEALIQMRPPPLLYSDYLTRQSNKKTHLRSQSRVRRSAWHHQQSWKCLLKLQSQLKSRYQWWKLIVQLSPFDLLRRWGCDDLAQQAGLLQ